MCMYMYVHVLYVVAILFMHLLYPRRRTVLLSTCSEVWWRWSGQRLVGKTNTEPDTEER